MIAGGHSRLLLSGGEISRIDAMGHATAKISGGKINTLRCGYVDYPLKYIEIICRDYDYNTGTKKLTGTWNVDNNKDGLFDIFNIQLIDIGQGYDTTINNIKFTIIPEPVTVVLLGIGGLLVRKQ